MNNEFQPNSNQKSAESEQALFNSGRYEEQQLANEAESKQKHHSRKEDIKDELHCWIIWFIRFFLGAAAISGAVYFWHMIMPPEFEVCYTKDIGIRECKMFSWHFLSTVQLDKISSFFVTVVLSGTFASYSKKFFEE